MTAQGTLEMEGEQGAGQTGTRAADPDWERSWDIVMSEAVAHLLSAHLAVEELARIGASTFAGVAFDLATQSVSRALVSLHECTKSLTVGSQGAS